MKARPVTIAALAAVLGLAAGCASASSATPPPPPAQVPAATPATSAPALTFTCAVATDASSVLPAYKITVTASAAETVTFTFIDVVFFNASGAEVGSDNTQPFIGYSGTTIAAGQSLTSSFDRDMTTPGGPAPGSGYLPQGVTGCEVTSWQ